MKFLVELWPVFLIALLVCIFFYPVFRGLIPLPADFVVGVYFPWLDYKWGYSVGVPVKNPITTDVVSFIYPMQMLAIDIMKNGQWPLWNPYILAGTPLLANFQSAPFSPTNIVYWLTDRLTAWSIQIMLQHFLAALFTYLLLRWWKLNKLPSVVGGLVYAFSGFSLIWSQWNGHTLTAAFLPLLLLLADMWFENKKWAGPLFSVAITFQIFSGYPQAVFYTAIALGLLWVCKFEWTQKFLIKTLILGVFGLLGVGLSAPQTLPGAELLSLSQREVEHHPFEWAFLPFSKVITFFAADFYGNHANQNYWGPQDYTSNTGFVGVASFILASIGLICVRNKKLIFPAILGAVALILAFPTPVSIFFWRAGWFGLQAASAHRSLILWTLAVSIFSGFGADYLLNGKKIPTLKSIVLPLLIVGGFATWAGILYFLSRDNPENFNAVVRGIPKYIVALRNSFFPIVFLIISSALLILGNTILRKKRNLVLWPLLVVIALELFRFGWRFTPFSPKHIVFPNTLVLDYLQNQEKPFRTTGSRVIPINMRMPYKIETLEGYDAVYPLHVSQFIAAITSGKSGTDPVGRYGTIGDETTKALDLVNVKYNIAVKRDVKNQPNPEGQVPEEYKVDKFKEVFSDKSVVVLENTKVLPRAFIVYDEEVVPGTAALDRILSPDFPLDKKIVLGADNVLLNTDGTGQAKYIEYFENRSTILTNSSIDGSLFISDTYYPGWHAFVDGTRTEIKKANFAFRAIKIPAGEHKVEFIYKPDSFFSGLKIALTSFIVLIIFSILVGKQLDKIYTNL